MQIFAENQRFSQKTTGSRRMGSVTLGASPEALPYNRQFRRLRLNGPFSLLKTPRKTALYLKRPTKRSLTEGFLDCTRDFFREEKGTQTQTFWSGYLRVGWGSSTWRGGGQKVRYVLRNPGKPNFWAGYPGILGGISRGRPRSSTRKSLCSILVRDLWEMFSRLFRHSRPKAPCT